MMTNIANNYHPSEMTESVSQHAALPAPQDTDDDYYDTNATEQDDDDTISEIPALTAATHRPTVGLTRNLSEMSIECSTATDENDDSVLDDELIQADSSNRVLIESKVKKAFALPASETLINEFPCYMIRLVTLPGWMYVTTHHICFYASLPGKKKGPHKAGYLSKKNHVTSPRTYRYYFELRNHVLSWYASAETKYSPLNSVDLKCVIKIEPSKLKRFGIRLTTNTHSHHTIIADSEISQREWLDELRKGVFVAQHAGNSVRIVLPFSKIMTVDKPSVFQFAANIRIKFQEDVAEHAANQGEDYYFAFFPDVEDAYRVITDTWKSSSATNIDTQKRVAVRTIDGSKPPGATGGASFLSFDSFLENISPAALPTMLMGKLMNVTSVFQQPSTENASAENDSLETSQKQQTSSLLSSVKIPYMSNMTKKKEDSAALTTSPNEMTTSSLASRLKRNSLFFNKSNSSTREDAKVIEDSSDASPKASPPSLGNASQDYFRGAAADAADATADKDQQPQYDVQPITINKTRPHSGSYSLAKIPRAVTDAFKHQVLKSDSSSSNSSVPAIEELPATSSTAEESQSALSIKSNNRSRSTSLSSFKHHISPYYLYNKINGSTGNTSASTLPAPHISNTSLTNANTDISLLSDADSSSLSTTTTQSRQQQPSVKNRKLRAMSMGSTLISGTWSKLAPGSVDHYFHQQHMNESQHRHPKGPIWLSDKMIDALEEAARANSIDHSDSVSTTSSSTSSDREEEEETSFAIDIQVHKFAADPNIRQEEQQTVNEHLNANFPMLLKTEETEAVIKASFWRTIPYSGKIYITDHYFCFNSKILAGQQKLIVPWHDVIQVNKIKTKSYYLLHGMTMVVKDMTDEIYFDFSSVQLRDHCYSICELKADGNLANDSSSVFSKESNTLSLSSLLLDRPEHIVPPREYDGPPLLSTSAKLSKPAESSKRPEKPLHFTCLTIGSRGDVQPYVALCKELQKDGHTCRIATHPEYEQWIMQHGIEFRSVGGDPGELMKLCIDNSFLSVSFIREGTKFFYSWFESLLASSYKACQGTDVIIESPSAMVGVHMAERLGVPYFRSMPFPFTRTTKFPHPFASQATAGGRIYNDMTYVMIDMALWAGTSKYVNRFRRDVLELPSTNLDRLELWRVPYIYSFSPSVVHPPKDWPDFIHCTGYWFLDNPDMKWKPDTALVDFLNDTNDTRPIVYIGFGSIIVPDAVETTQIIVEAVLKANVRAIICKGWSARVTTAKVSDKKSRSASDMELIKQEEAEQEQDSEVLLDKYPGTIYHIDSVPHDWLFPQIQGVVHHGGAGTTAAGLRAGLPTVIKPFFGDQRFWGQRIEELQVGICLNKLSKTHLADALKTITQNQTIIVKASKVGETIRKENGPRNAVESIYREFQYAKEQRVVNS